MAAPPPLLRAQAGKGHEADEGALDEDHDGLGGGQERQHRQYKDPADVQVLVGHHQDQRQHRHPQERAERFLAAAGAAQGQEQRKRRAQDQPAQRPGEESQPAQQLQKAAPSAFQQAKAQKLNVFSGEKDPDFFYGDAYELDLKHLRTNISLYDNAKVAFEGVITYNNNNSVYVEEYDAETDMYYGMSVYYGYETGALLNILKVGNRVRVVGTVTYYETGGTWQVSGLKYREMKPDDPGNTIMISEGNKPAHRETDPDILATCQMDVETLVSHDGEETELKTLDDVAAYLTRRANQIKDNQGMCFYIYHNDNIIGRIRFFDIQDDGCEIGYWLIKSANGNGFMSEALQALETELFKFGFGKITLDIDNGNIHSENIAKRNKYKLKKILPMASWAKCVGKCDSLIYVKER